METESINPTKPGVMDALADDAAMQLWECLRAREFPADAAELANDIAQSLASTQRGLDLLEAAKLVRKIRASRERRAITYAVTSGALVVVVPDGAEGRRLYDQLAAITVRREFTILSRLKSHSMRGRGEWFFDQVTDFTASFEEIKELQRRVYAVSSYILELAERSSASHNRTDERLRHAVQLRAGALTDGVSRFPQLRVFTKQAVIDQRQGRDPAPGVLGAREREIAKLLQEGLSRADVAGRLGISVQTVGSHCKRIFEKLGIRRVIELNRFDFATSRAPIARRRSRRNP